MRATQTPSLTIAELQTRAFRQAADKGFHEYVPSNERALISYVMEKIALMHGELSEANEEVRRGHPVRLNYYPAEPQITEGVPSYREPGTGGQGKPEGVPAELADTVIRVLDFCGAYGINLEAAIIEKLDYNATRGRMHGANKA